MFAKSIFLILSVVVVFGDAGFVDSLKKCSVKDNECLKAGLQNIFKEYGKKGIPEFDVPVFDPVAVKDVSLELLNVVNLTLIEGKLKGLSGCVVNKFQTNVEKKHLTLDLTCDLVLKGTYKAFSQGPLIRSVLGGDTLMGNGKTKVKIDKFNIQFNINFDLLQRDGDLYLQSRDDKLNYKYSVLDRVEFATNNLLLDGKDVSEQVTNLMNQSWRIILQTIGDDLMGRTIEPARTILRRIFDNVPTKHFLTDDLTPYL